MSKYRIIEKRGTYTKQYRLGYYCSDEIITTDTYISRFIVQEYILMNEEKTLANFYRDLKEFNNIKEAREYKRDLELDLGIVIE